MKIYKLNAYNKDDPKKSEFDGFTFEAQSWEHACKIFSGLSGEYGCPADQDYDIVDYLYSLINEIEQDIKNHSSYDGAFKTIIIKYHCIPLNEIMRTKVMNHFL